MGWNRRAAQLCAAASPAAFHFAASAKLHMFAVVLVHPEIPPNTGNVIRLTANSGTDLHLVEPLGFRMDDKALKRAGLDYHEYARVRVHADYAACRSALDATAPRRHFAFTTHAAQSLADVRYEAGDVLVFGSETRGRPAAELEGFEPAFRVRIPMRAGIRSINLSNAVAVAVYEAWRQHGYAGAG
jgi:tRNA (cytidine/uridine-2'-O-)-methyltransferase